MVNEFEVPTPVPHVVGAADVQRDVARSGVRLRQVAEARRVELKTARPRRQDPAEGPAAAVVGDLRLRAGERDPVERVVRRARQPVHVEQPQVGRQHRAVVRVLERRNSRGVDRGAGEEHRRVARYPAAVGPRVGDSAVGAVDAVELRVELHGQGRRDRDRNVARIQALRLHRENAASLRRVRRCHGQARREERSAARGKAPDQVVVGHVEDEAARDVDLCGRAVDDAHHRVRERRRLARLDHELRVRRHDMNARQDVPEGCPRRRRPRRRRARGTWARLRRRRRRTWSSSPRPGDPPHPLTSDAVSAAATAAASRTFRRMPIFYSLLSRRRKG